MVAVRAGHGPRVVAGARRLVAVVASVALVATGVVVVAAPAEATAWNPAVTLSAAGQHASSPQVASSADGKTVTAVWTRSDGSDYLVQASRSLDGGATWSTPVQLSASGGGADGPQVVSSADGNTVTVAWRRDNGSDYIAQASSTTDGGAHWSTPVDLSAAGRSVDTVRVAASTDGTTVTVVWMRPNPAWWQLIQSATSTDSGTTWGTPVDLTATGRDAYSPDVAASSDGRTLTAVWHRYDGSNYRAQAATSTDTGATWSTPYTLSAADQNAGDERVTTSTDGTTSTAIWRRKNDDGYYIVQTASTTDTGASWSTAIDLSASGRDADYPQLASSADGTTSTVAWERSDGTRDRVQATTSDDTGATWSLPADISAAGQNAQVPQVTTSADGTTPTAVWKRWNGSKYIVQAATSTDTGATWGTPADLSEAGQNADEPQVSSSASGRRTTAVWDRYDGSKWIVQAAGGGIPGPLTFSPTTGAFGSVTLGQTGQVTVTVTNTGGAPATPSAITPAGDGVTVTGGTCAVATPIAADGSCTLEVTWVPAAAGSLTGGSVSIAYPGDPTDVLPLTGTAVDRAALTPTFGAVTRTADGFAVDVTNYDGAWTWAASVVSGGGSVTAGTASGSTLPLMVTGLAPGASATVRVTTTRTGWVDGSADKAGTALDSALTPTFGAVTRTPDGFAVDVTNYDGAWTWAASVVSGGGSVATGTPSGATLPLTVTGLAPGSSATVSVTTTRTGWVDGSAEQAGTALAAPTPEPPAPAPPAPEPPAPPEPEPDTSPAMQQQVPLTPLALPARLRNSGWTRLFSVPVTTNAGQNASWRVVGSPIARALAPAGDVTTLRVRQRNGAVWVWLSGTTATRVRVTVSAPAVPGFTAYRAAKVYRTRVAE